MWSTGYDWMRCEGVVCPSMILPSSRTGPCEKRTGRYPRVSRRSRELYQRSGKFFYDVWEIFKASLQDDIFRMKIYLHLRRELGRKWVQNGKFWVCSALIFLRVGKKNWLKCSLIYWVYFFSFLSGRSDRLLISPSTCDSWSSSSDNASESLLANSTTLGVDFTRDFYRLVKFESTKSLSSTTSASGISTKDGLDPSCLATKGVSNK